MKTNEIAKIIETDPQTIFYTKEKYGMCKYFRITNTVDDINSGKTNKGFEVRFVWIGWNNETNSHVVTTMEKRAYHRVRNFRITGVYATTEQEAIERVKELEAKREIEREESRKQTLAMAAKREQAEALSRQVATALNIEDWRAGINYGNATITLNMTHAQAEAIIALANSAKVIQA